MKHEYALVRILSSWWHFGGRLVLSLGLMIFGLLVIPALLHNGGAHDVTAQQGVLLSATVFAIGVLIFIATAVKRRHTAWSLTSERLIERRGVFATRRRELELADVRSVEVDRSLSQRILGLGDVSV
ncbi:MAG: PH domain-containing protein, partial [Pseudomonadota bacterium]